MIHAAIAQADIALPSLDDARVLTGLEAPEAIADFYLRLGCRLVLLKQGDAGVLVATAEGGDADPACRVQAVDATGAGDAFAGAFLARAWQATTRSPRPPTPMLRRVFDHRIWRGRADPRPEAVRALLEQAAG